jgi:hypothetical protein
LSGRFGWRTASKGPQRAIMAAGSHF